MMFTFFTTGGMQSRYDKKWLHWNRWATTLEQKTQALLQTRIYRKQRYWQHLLSKSGHVQFSRPSSSQDHMKQIRRAGAGVLVVSWYPPNQHDNEGRASDTLIPLLLDKAAGLVCGSHFILNVSKAKPESVRMIWSTSLTHMVVMKHFIETWKVSCRWYMFMTPIWFPLNLVILKQESRNSIRNSKYDSIMIGLLVDAKHKEEIKKGGWDGFYTYFAVDGMTYGSSFITFIYWELCWRE